MNMLLVSEHNRLTADLEKLDERLANTKRGYGLRSRSVHSFLSQLRKHKREMLKTVDQQMAGPEEDAA
ncbi:MAG: hypothetical protein KDK91_04310 [Gammaproteobacteria bacterium]|nr:hypothetical protein [Gammaproteobacteria bacterium]